MCLFANLRMNKVRRLKRIPNLQNQKNLTTTFLYFYKTSRQWGAQCFVKREMERGWGVAVGLSRVVSSPGSSTSWQALLGSLAIQLLTITIPRSGCPAVVRLWPHGTRSLAAALCLGALPAPCFCLELCASPLQLCQLGSKQLGKLVLMPRPLFSAWLGRTHHCLLMLLWVVKYFLALYVSHFHTCVHAFSRSVKRARFF